MKNKVNKILIGFLLMAFSYTALAEVTTLSIATDTSWKSLDFENAGWTSENYDDSWWTPAEERDYCTIEPGKMIWYSSTVKPKIAYFRNVFEIDGTEILNGKLYTGMAAGGIIYLFVNDNPIEKITDTDCHNPSGIDITSYLKPGKNTIAAKVDASAPYNTLAWALIGTIRYNKLTPGQPIN